MSGTKSSVVIRIIIATRLLCGFYTKVSSNKIVDALVRAYCVIFSMTVFSILCTVFSRIPLIKVTFMFTFSLIYACNVILDHCFYGDKFFEFVRKMRHMSISQDSRSCHVKLPITMFITILLLCSRLFSHLKYMLENKYVIHMISMQSLGLAYDLIQLVSVLPRILMFELIWRQMIILRKQVQEDLFSIRRLEAGEELLKNKLKVFSNAYKNILNSTREIDSASKLLIFITLISLNLEMLNQLYGIIISYFHFNNSAILIEIAIKFVVIISPALLAEMVNSEIDKMKLCIVKQLLVVQGDSTRDAIEDIMLYLKQNPFKYTIWRLFTLDMTVILSFIGVFTTYTVALVQFTHFFV